MRSHFNIFMLGIVECRYKKIFFTIYVSFNDAELNKRKKFFLNKFHDKTEVS